MPKVSVMMPCYQGERYIEQAIRSVIAQSYPDFELIVLDDGSRDRSGEVVRGFDDPRVRYVYQENRGLAAARNRLLDLAGGEYAAFLDQDDYWSSERLQRQVALLEAQPDTALVYADCQIVDSSGAIRGCWSDRNKLLRGKVFDALLCNNFIPLPTVLARKAALQAVGGFQSYRVSEEYDVFLKCAARWRFDFVPQPLAFYRVHPEQFSRRYEVALDDLLAVYRFWEREGVSRARLAVPRAMAYFDAGKAAIYRDRDCAKARGYLRQSLAARPLARALAFFALSFVQPDRIGQVRRIAVRARRAYSYSDIASGKGAGKSVG